MDKSYWDSFFESSNMSVLWIIIIGVLIFLVIREVLCWYFKFNRMVELMEQINSKLDNLSQPIKVADIQSRKHTNNNMPEIKPNLEVAADKEVIKPKEDKRKISDILTKEYHLSDLFSKEDEKHNLER